MFEIVTDAERPDLGGDIRHGDGSTFAPRLWRYLVERHAITSVLDVGCGEGHAVRFFHRLGLIAHGIDGLRANIERAVFPIALHDLLASPYVMPVDLVWSCEVAEHIHPDKVDFFLDTLINGRVVAMTHALPDQPGHHPVNCQPQEYWIEHMFRRGYHLAHDYVFFREVAGRDECYNYFQTSGLLFLRNQR